MEIRGKTVWITGASSGIGAALAQECARCGARLLLTARREDRLQEVAAACRNLGAPEVCLLTCDLSEIDAIPGYAENAIRLMGQIDVLVNNAGLGQRSLGVETDVSVVRTLMDVNFLSYVEMTRAILPKMIERGAGQIVITSSVCGKFSMPRRTIYCASKHALQGYFDALRAEVQPLGVQVTVFTPGWIQSEISLHALLADGSTHERMDLGQKRGMPADRCARKMVAAIRRGKREVYVGGWMERCGLWLQRYFPGFFAWGVRTFQVNR